MNPFSVVCNRAVRIVNSYRVIWLIFSLLVTLIANDSSSVAQSTNIAIGTTVQRSPVKRLGVNLGGQTAYDSGQIMRNLIFQNPGFEGETWQSVLHCVSVTAGSCTDANVYNVWPANFLKGASYEFISGAASGQTGTITSSTVSAYIAGSSNPNYGLTINFPSSSIAPQVGDYVIVRMQVPGNAQAGWWTSASGGATFSTDFSDLAADSPGTQALEMNAAGSGQSASLDSYFDSYAGRSFVQMNGTYTLAFKAKGKGGNKQLTFSVQRLGTPAHGTETLLNQSITLASGWQDYSYSFNAAEDGTYIGTVQVSFSVAGADIYIDDATLMSPAAPNNPTVFSNEVVNALRTLRPGVIRYMAGTDFGSSTANIVAPPFARQRAGINSQATVQDDIPMGIEEFLVLCQTIGAEPWYTMAGEATPEDMQNLIEFLGGASTTPYGAKRAALGQSAPWTTVFPVIHLELGNEMWNSSMTGEAISDPVVYGQRAGKIFAAARSSASYNPSKFDLIMGSFAVNAWWTQEEMTNGSGYDSVDAAPYLFNTFNDYSSNESIFGPMFAQPEQIDSNSTGYMAQQQQAAAGGSTPAKLAVYEVNLSTVSGTAPQNTVNQAAGGVAAGITVADHMLLMMRDLGITTQNTFALSGYVSGFSNPSVSGETTPLWGTVIDMGGETNVQRPTYLAERLVNSAILPTMLATSVTGANPTWNQPLSTNDNIQLSNAHYLQSFAFTDGTNKSVIVFNLSRSGSLPITFSGANAPTGNVLISQLTSKNITDNNEGLTSDNPVVVPTQVDVSNFNPATPYSLPPYSMTVFHWPGATLPATTTTLEASPTSGTVGQTIMLTATVDSESGTNIPTGQVTFLNGSASLGTATLNSSGLATYSTSSLPAGSDQLSASYSGDAEDAGSTSPIVTVQLTTKTYPPPLGHLDSAMDQSTGATTLAPGDTLFVSGWIADPTDGSPLSNVKVLIDSTPVGTPTLGISRPDVAAYYNNPAYANSGFTFTYPASSLTGGPHAVTVVGVNSHAVSATLGPLTITIEEPFGHLDRAVDASTGGTAIDSWDNLVVSGWIADPTDGSPLANVKVVIDGVSVGTPTLDVPRPDVAAAYNNQAYANSGFTFSYSGSLLAAGYHAVTVVGVDSHGVSATLGPKTIAARPPIGHLDQAADESTGATTIPNSDTLFVSGWIADPTDGSPMSNVKVFIDGVSIGKPTLGIPRPDVAAGQKTPAYLDSGFTLDYPAASLAAGSHVVTVVGVDSHGVSTTLNPLTITVTQP